MSDPRDQDDQGDQDVSRRIRLVAGPEHEGLRMDQFLAAASPLSRRRARTLLSDGKVAVGGRVSRKQSRTVQQGLVADLLLTAEEARELALPREPDLPEPTIVHRDDWLIAVDKPSGVLSQPAEHRQPGELAMDERLLMHLAAREGKKPFLRLVHRIDRVTSGLLLFAASPKATGPLDDAWRSGAVDRVYLAVVEGVPEDDRFTVDGAIGKQPGDAWRFEVREGIGDGARPARTEVEVVRRGDDFAVVACRLDTGRTHQVRVHLAHAGFPVRGDRLYGADTNRFPAPRPLLHAAELALPHPDGKSGRLELRAEVPEEFRPFWDAG